MAASFHVEPGEHRDERLILSSDHRFLQEGSGGVQHGDAQRANANKGAGLKLEILGQAPREQKALQRVSAIDEGRRVSHPIEALLVKSRLCEVWLAIIAWGHRVAFDANLVAISIDRHKLHLKARLWQPDQAHPVGGPSTHKLPPVLSPLIRSRKQTESWSRCFLASPCNRLATSSGRRAPASTSILSFEKNDVASSWSASSASLNAAYPAGTFAFVLARKESAHTIRRPRFRVAGTGEALKHTNGGWFDIVSSAGVASGQEAFAQAGITPAEIKYASLYDSFTITVVVQIEDLGFCRKGEGGKSVADGNLISGVGRLPFNTDGGGLCSNHPGNKGGMTKLLEAIRQCRGEAHPAVQVENHDWVLAHGTGGLMSGHHAAGTAILKEE